MTIHRKKRRKAKKIETSTRHLTEIELKAIVFVSTLLVAGIAIIQKIEDPVVWAFLSTALGITLGRSNSK